MRDIIWTIIGIWVLWRIIEAFRSFSSNTRRRQQGAPTSQNNAQNTYQNSSHTQQPKKGELKPDAGEYIDYEEVK